MSDKPDKLMGILKRLIAGLYHIDKTPCIRCVICKQGLAEAHTAIRELQKRETDKFLEIFVWLQGYTDFPAREEGDYLYYWRRHLSKKLKEIGITDKDLKAIHEAMAERREE
jgi:predicted Abi (CAAX) family protease